MSFKFLQLSTIGLILVYVLIGLMAITVLQKKRYALIAGLGTAILLTVILCVTKQQQLHQQKLVAYNLGKRAQVELIIGNTHQSLYSDTTAKDNYVLNSARTGFQAWRAIKILNQDNYLTFKGQKILQLRNDISLSNIVPFPLDILMIERPLKGLSPAGINAAFHPKKIVIASGQSRYLIKKWQDSCLKMGIPLHAVSINGAFILD